MNISLRRIFWGAEHEGFRSRPTPGHFRVADVNREARFTVPGAGAVPILLRLGQTATHGRDARATIDG
jgi:hypothetical protein